MKDLIKIIGTAFCGLMVLGGAISTISSLQPNVRAQNFVLTLIFLVLTALLIRSIYKDTMVKTSNASAPTDHPAYTYRAKPPVQPSSSREIETAYQGISFNVPIPIISEEKLKPITPETIVYRANQMFGIDELLPDAIEIVAEVRQASITMLQGRLKLGYGRAARLVDQMEQLGVVGPFEGSKPREIYINNGKEIANALSSCQKKTIDVQKIIQDEMQWRAEQGGVATPDYELDKIDGIEGHEFEHWCADLLQKIGFINVEVTQGSGDQGVDILAIKDGIKYAIQCKCYSSDLGNKPIQEVNTGKTIYHCHVGAVMTNRYFTAGGKEAAKATGILLWDRDKLKEMLEQANAPT